MFERFTDRARRVLVLAQEEARSLQHNFIGSEHILLGLLRADEGVAAAALRRNGISLTAARANVLEVDGPSKASASGSPPFTPRAKKVLELALREALELGHSYIGTEHMLLGLVREGECVGAMVLGNLGAELHRIRQDVIEMLSGTAGGFAPDGAVSGDLVEKTDIPVGAGALLGWEDAAALLRAGPLLTDARTERSERDGVVYETCTYHPCLPPEVSVAVAGAIVTREAFDDYTNRWLPDAEHIDGLGEAATYSVSSQSLRVLAGSTIFVIQVRGHHPQAREASIDAARRALGNLPGPPPTG